MNYWMWCTLLLSIVSPFFYTKAILAGKARPHRITRLIVWLAAAAGMLGVLHSSSTAGIVFAAIFLVRASYLLVVAAICGVGGASRLDKTCLLLAVAALAVYICTGSGLLAILVGIASDLIGYIPTFVKTWHHPGSEDPKFFVLESLGSLLAVFAIGQLRVDILFPLYFVMCGLSVLFLIYRPRVTKVVGTFRRSADISEIPPTP